MQWGPLTLCISPNRNLKYLQSFQSFSRMYRELQLICLLLLRWPISFGSTYG